MFLCRSPDPCREHRGKFYAKIIGVFGAGNRCMVLDVESLPGCSNVAGLSVDSCGDPQYCVVGAQVGIVCTGQKE